MDGAHEAASASDGKSSDPDGYTRWSVWLSDVSDTVYLTSDVDRSVVYCWSAVENGAMEGSAHS